MTASQLNKPLHFFVGLALCVLIAPFGLGLAFAATMAAAVLKEACNYVAHGEIDPLDLLAVGLGAAGGALLVYLFSDAPGVAW